MQEKIKQKAIDLLNLDELDSFRDFHYREDLMYAFTLGYKLAKDEENGNK